MSLLTIALVAVLSGVIGATLALLAVGLWLVKMIE